MSVPDVTPDAPGAGWRLTLALLGRLPQAALSRGFGAIADVPVPRALRRRVLGAAARTLGMDLAEAELPLEQYGSLNELFVRRLRPGLRPVSDDPLAIASPVDGVIGQYGHVRGGELVQAKGRHYSAAALLDDEAAARRFEQGTFITLYLSPRHYHRIHAPCTGTIAGARHVPGALLPVNEPAVQHVAGLFPRNERLIAYLDGAPGYTAVVAVGAYNVGRISAAFDTRWSAAGWVTNRRDAHADTRRYDPPLPVRKGEEIMAFHLGSTVVLLVEGELRLDTSLESGREVRLGTDLARRMS
jgi:phosphatidylserine decarboxylase